MERITLYTNDRWYKSYEQGYRFRATTNPMAQHCHKFEIDRREVMRTSKDSYTVFTTDSIVWK